MYSSLAFFLVLSVACSVECDTEDKLLQTHIMYRHGDRSAITLFPTDPICPGRWYQGLGQLSKKGMRQHYELGVYFRKRYVDELLLLNHSYIEAEVAVYSTDSDRTIQSAQCNLYGLYPVDTVTSWNPKSTWHPIPIHPLPKSPDDIIMELLPCERYQVLKEMNMEYLLKLPQVLRYSGMLAHLSRLSGLPEDFRNLFRLSDTLYCETNHFNESEMVRWLKWKNITGTGEMLLPVLRKLSTLNFKMMVRGNETARLYGGTILYQIFHDMDVMLQQSPDIYKNWTAIPMQKMIVYSAHDTSVTGLLAAFQLFSSPVYDLPGPPYHAAVMVELYRGVGSGPYIKILYNNRSDQHDAKATVHELTIPGCSVKCPLSKAKELLSHYFLPPEEFVHACHNSPSLSEAPPLLTPSDIVAIAVCVSVAVSLGFATLLCFARRSICSKGSGPTYTSVPH